ncbi:MAG TPA: alpha/beta hydrolase, partial [Pirellula sp.]|nr:alpha/beta hydrolase [Pirellula sp.]
MSGIQAPEPVPESILVHVTNDYRRKMRAVRFDLSASNWTYEIDWLLAAIAVALFLIALAAFICMFVSSMENNNTFQPRKLSCYKYVFGTWYDLCSGGKLLNYTGCSEQALGVYRKQYPCQPFTPTPYISSPPVYPRRVLFLHGSTECLDTYALALEELRVRGYDVWALEYSGYGNATASCWLQRLRPNHVSWEMDVLEAYDKCKQTGIIVAGYSLGGSVVGQVYEQMCGPRPAQLVFLNTFQSFPDLACSRVPQWCTEMLRGLIRTRWKTAPPCQYDGQVLIINTADD